MVLCKVNVLLERAQHWNLHIVFSPYCVKLSFFLVASWVEFFNLLSQKNLYVLSVLWLTCFRDPQEPFVLHIRRSIFYKCFRPIYNQIFVGMHLDCRLLSYCCKQIHVVCHHVLQFVFVIGDVVFEHRPFQPLRLKYSLLLCLLHKFYLFNLNKTEQILSLFLPDHELEINMGAWACGMLVRKNANDLFVLSNLYGKVDLAEVANLKDKLVLLVKEFQATQAVFLAIPRLRMDFNSAYFL